MAQMFFSRVSQEEEKEVPLLSSVTALPSESRKAVIFLIDAGSGARVDAACQRPPLL